MATQFSTYPVPKQNPYLGGSIQQAIPELGGLTQSATNIIQSELTGLPDPGETRTANAAWAAGAGLPPGTPFAENRGRRLYNSEIENRRRQGLQDLLSFLQGYSGTVSATPGQLLQGGAVQTQSDFENQMAVMERQLAQRQLDESNNRLFSKRAPGVTTTSGQPYGYKFFM